MTCTCGFCEWHSRYQEVMKDVPEQHRAFFDEMANIMVEAQDDAAYYKSIVRNEYPNADKIMAIYRKDKNETVCK